ncbi:FAD-binding oxidoreductase [Rhodococcus aetherivorans]|uniref:FAD-binding oxidoreductase n=1 Tax=Rhodococcus aetherivorans TaxID=191292 RepID=A0AA46NTB9_9NOCA|nr:MULTISPECIES: FAD-binding oxidoreductase [Rhodococcus]MBC2587292.1 FAD-binding oxidoreductase [Rhodococcus aetherivorans]QRI74617.1 FAD-binding oxidoreductase [Rhodococcus aetherivorans]QSE58028.1 FAD-binding oxidoreductase [Rhodococcus sp. PSBB066]QSE70643.1 FAD-binding oxidoreductase [Rhodococcus sp. PSBB049]USC17703.1 FAD-binding oxidoreductase [Rhodococcus sp. 11-3]
MTVRFTPQHPTAAAEMEWDAWGTADRRKELGEGVRTLLRQALGVDTERARSLPETAVRLTPSRLGTRHHQGLRRIVGPEHVADDDAARLRHAGGKSTLDLLRRQNPGPQDGPDAVLRPGSHDEVLAVLDYCTGEGIAVVPFGGGTSVVGGLDPVRDGFEAVVAVDLQRMNALTDLDPVSGLATLQAGATGPQAEELLGAHGFSLGHFPQSFRHATVGGFAVTRSSGQASAGHGRFDEMVEHLVVATPRGTVRAGRAPASAAGPDLRQLFLGSEGLFGIVTEVGVRIHPIPAATAHRAWSFPDFATGADALRTLVQTGAVPTVLRLSDETETATNLALHEHIGATAPTGCLAVTTVEGTAEHVRARAAEVDALLSTLGGTDLGEEPARAWEQGRFDAPHLRDALLRVGALAETLETATTWSNLARLRTAVTDALTASLQEQGTPPLVLCHISHTYPTGASLYFTVVCAQTDDPLTQWSAAKRAATDAIMTAGGTVTHHHAVGRDHRPWMADEIGTLGTGLLRAVKDALDPLGILNPGKLLP